MGAMVSKPGAFTLKDNVNSLTNVSICQSKVRSSVESTKLWLYSEFVYTKF